uniref:Uncharacterized protein n=1 Tax=Siphoviridae sp. ctbbV81 TaxID=2827900 RepID=A0A8S5TQS8_9CAUD|nr:MAG TPA: hypothetical protein [Siphoviridae sp. ctbbV81]DAG27165.1 MAG TPA: hypothetical protein [Caudoviricetes sp.]DAH50146.1 MAG TPA: hypothetical protein [Caudoviricetes sp.]
MYYSFSLYHLLIIDINKKVWTYYDNTNIHITYVIVKVKS